MRLVDVPTSWLASVLSLGRGLFVHRSPGPRPVERLVLYEFEGCPFCRRVREALSQLDLEAEVRPCPKGGERFRPEVVERGGRAMFPFLVDPDHGVAMYESADIVAHLYRHYGARRMPWYFWTPFFLLSSQLTSLVRVWRGVRVRASLRPGEPLELYSFEASPYCRLVREALTELELPYVLHNVAKRSPSRPAFVERGGRMRVPWLHDPNTGTSLFESGDIVRYLEETYRT